MADKREPIITLLLRYKGKKKSHKVEIFRADLWQLNAMAADSRVYLNSRYRLRINGKWFRQTDDKYTFLTKYEIRDALWRSIKF